MRVYIAGAFVEQHFRARPMMAKLREAGITISHDWTQAEGDVCSCGHGRDRHGKKGTRWETQCEQMMPTGHVGDVEPCPCPAFNGIGAGSDAALTPEQRKQFALDDLKGVLTADVMWLLAANDKGACGSWVELGAALAAREYQRVYEKGPNVKIVVSGAKWNRTIFTELADQTFVSDEEALNYVRGLAR